MPIYEYQCKKCNEKFEMFRGIYDSDSSVTCPKCGEKNPKRVISAVCGGKVTYSNKGNLRFPT